MIKFVAMVCEKQLEIRRSIQNTFGGSTKNK